MMLNRFLAAITAGLLILMTVGWGECNPSNDDNYCDGVERCNWLGQCAEGPPPCDDANPCTDDFCDEAFDHCYYVLDGVACPTCYSDCIPDCGSAECGDDGCGGYCPDTCAWTTGEVCQDHIQTCATELSIPGTCANPIQLASTYGVQVVAGDSTESPDLLSPSCNPVSTAGDMVYELVINDFGTGLEARVSGYDTVLFLTEGDCATQIACEDDSAPPGDFGSAVTAELDPGTYYLVVDGYDASQFGEFELTVKLAQGCVPQCDGRYCGDDGCGGSCGGCEDDELCEVIPGVGQQCQPIDCVPDCEGKNCGDDGCGSTCGTCPDGELCVFDTQVCQNFAECDHHNPTCEGCGLLQYCGSDCQCYDLEESVPDLIVIAEQLGTNEIELQEFTEDSCAVLEECVQPSGTFAWDIPGLPFERKLLKFNFVALNQGLVDLVVPPPGQRPDLFAWDQCHGHFHYEGFAEYALVDAQGNMVVPGRKQSFCVEDSYAVMEGPHVPCAKQFTCDDQGISAGWADEYNTGLDCQWLDVTGVPPGDYKIRATVNPGRAFHETSFDNNTAEWTVTIP